MGQVAFADEIDVKYDAPAALPDEAEPYSVYDYDEVPENKSWAGALPLKQGLYDPALEKDACGVGFAAYGNPFTCFSGLIH